MKPGSNNNTNLKDFVNTNNNLYKNSKLILKLVNVDNNEKYFIGSQNRNTATYYTVVLDPKHSIFPMGNIYYCTRMEELIEIVEFMFANEEIYATKQIYLNSEDVLDQPDTISLDDKRYESLYKDLSVDPDIDTYE